MHKSIKLAALALLAVSCSSYADVAKIGGGYSHSLYINGNDVYVAGDNSFGQAGNVDTSDMLYHPLGISNALSVVGHPLGTVVLLKDGTAVYLGYNIGTGERHYTPINVPNISGAPIDDIAVSLTKIAYIADGGLYEWDFKPDSLPVHLGIYDASAVSCGYDFCISKTDTDDAYTWGQNYLGQLGDATKYDRLTPTLIATNVKGVSAGRVTAALVHHDNNGKGWGYGRLGQIGDGYKETRLAPADVVDTFERIRVGNSSSYGLTVTGELFTWGVHNIIDSPSGMYLSNVLPTAVPGVSNIYEFFPGHDFTLVLTNDGDLLSMGGSGKGKLGAGNNTETHQFNVMVTGIVIERPVTEVEVVEVMMAMETTTHERGHGRTCNEEDDNNGHGNDCDGVDEGNKGKSKGKNKR